MKFFTHPSRKPAPTFTQIDGFDRITMHLDRPEPPFPLELLKPHCTNVVAIASQPRYQANRKFLLELFQPTKKCLQVIRKGLGREVCLDITYTEVARDIVPADPDQVSEMLAAFLGCARMPSERDVVLSIAGKTWYYSRERKNGNHLTLYGDKPSKINNAKPEFDAPLCLHVEWRASGKEALSNIGIMALDDLINFDFDGHWDNHLKLYDQPSKTLLGRKLARIEGGKTDASNPAYLKRANAFLGRHSKHDIFILQNALNSMPELARRLKLLTWQEWIDAYL